MALQRKVESFDKHLKDEAVLSNNYYSEKAKYEKQPGGKRNDIQDDVYDLSNMNANDFEDELLVEDD